MPRNGETASGYRVSSWGDENVPSLTAVTVAPICEYSKTRFQGVSFMARESDFNNTVTRELWDLTPSSALRSGFAEREHRDRDGTPEVLRQWRLVTPALTPAWGIPR